MTDETTHEPESDPPVLAPATTTAIPQKGTEAYTVHMREMGRRGGLAAKASRDAAAQAPHPSNDEALDSEDPSLTLRMMMRVQRSIALGQGKPKPSPQQQTAAAKAWGELRIQLMQHEHASDSTAFDLATLTDRLDVLRWCVGATEDDLVDVRAWLSERQG